MTTGAEVTSGPVDLGPGRRSVRLAAGPSGVLNTRSLALGGVGAVACTGLTVLALMLGDFPLAVGRVVDVVLGSEQGFARTVVIEWRLPRATAAVVFGAALGVSGAIFQSLTRNPLGSPDVIGFNAGAYTGALVAVLWWGGGAASTPTAALVGGTLTAVVVYGASFRHGPAGLGFVLVGVAVAAGLTALNTLLIMRMGTNAALVATAWGQGTLEDLRWHQVTPMVVAILALGVVVLALARSLRQLELGDDVARSSGVALGRSRLALLSVGVALTAVVTSICGPIAFVALAAPQIARLLTRAPGADILGAAVVGAVLLAGSDVLANHLLSLSLPVGVATVVLGGGYLTWLVARQVRAR